MLRNINPYSDVLTEQRFHDLFVEPIHEFAGINYIKEYRSLIEKQNCECEIIFANQAKAILSYTNNVLACNIRTRRRTKRILNSLSANIYGLDEILSAPINGSGFNKDYGLLGSSKATNEIVKLFPKDAQWLVDEI